MQQILIINRLYSVVCLLSSALYICRERSTNQPFYAKQTQFPKKSNDVSFFYTMEYENKSDWTIGQSKPNSNPIKPNSQKAKMNVNLYVIVDYRKNDDFVVRINKPNSRKTQNERKLFFTKRCQTRLFCHIGSSTSVENPLQIGLFMQNKANFPDAQMNVNKVLTKDYEEKCG